MSILVLSVIAANALAWALVFAVEVVRRLRAEPVAIPFSALLLVLATQLLLFDLTAAFRAAMPLILLMSIREAFYFVSTNRSELCLAGAVGAGLGALGVLTWWLVHQIHAHFNLGL